MTLDQLHPAQSATVLAIELPFELRERLAALGVKVGRRLSLIHRVGKRGPLQVRAGNTDFILRPREAAGIEVGE
ncbi:MAG: FeoA family protein [Betaproteobacteria bacterium]